MTNPPALATGALFDDEPMSRVLGLDAKTSSTIAWFGFTSGGIGLLAGLLAAGAVAAWLHVRAGGAVAVPQEIEFATENPTPPAANAQPDDEKNHSPTTARRTSPKEAPAPARDAKVLTAEPKPDDPVDLTGNEMVQGIADSFPGGVTRSTGAAEGVAASACSGHCSYQFEGISARRSL